MRDDVTIVKKKGIVFEVASDEILLDEIVHDTNRKENAKQQIEKREWFKSEAAMRTLGQKSTI